ncbi:hypothetical protein A1O7_01739 [Cladophialophora yegresii CBS 114405]|uniref:Fungal N-terminal domain-containing protein n=1 Tax=Cladophialophora yegresii CBS 114405 TaxID=1182544 RepID=W9WBU5_9EURO|nr:uncharacterized protein A1O7_01739 [Cladophialophora yegresii CBS 114405]EXJ65398.1 hypothetical protein A1O7_01739 [Cladophialophora yegresii CBS 114405]
MPDTLTVMSLATESLSICIKVVSILKQYASAVKTVKKDLVALLKRVERMRNVLGLLRSLALELSKTSQKSVQLEIDRAECENTMDELLTLAKEVEAKKQIMSGLSWGAKKSSAAKLTRELREIEEDIINVVTVVGTTSSLRAQVDIEALKVEAGGHSEVHIAFENLSIVDGSLQAATEEPGAHKPIRTWLGHVLRYGHSEHYLAWRDRLSDAAFWGRWDDAWDALKTGGEEYHEIWLNAVRMKRLEESDQMSFFWMPLHQAAYTRAPIEVVSRLIEAGASRKDHETRWTRYSCMDMTALELAREFGFSYLYHVLAPVIRNPVPFVILTRLQDQFHDIVRKDLGARVIEERMYLPQLEVLTEMGNEPMWYPVKFASAGAGYVFRLDERVLIVRAVTVTGDAAIQTYRIPATEVQSIDDELVSDVRVPEDRKKEED